MWENLPKNNGNYLIAVHGTINEKSTEDIHSHWGMTLMKHIYHAYLVMCAARFT